jgi:hypothetical protein
MDVRIETIGHWLREFHERFRVVVEGLTAEQLLYAPAPDTNPIAVLVRHAVLTEHGMLAGLAGQPIQRDLPGEFVARPATAEELLALLDEADHRLEEMLRLISGDALAALYPRPHDQVLTGGEWAVHTYGHVKEHVAHAELTRQLLQAER